MISRCKSLRYEEYGRLGDICFDDKNNQCKVALV